MTFPDGLDRTLLTQDEIQRRVADLGVELAAHYGDRNPLLVGVLNGAVIFMADLVRQMRVPVDFEFMSVSSYGNATSSSGVVRIVKDLDSSIEGREVLLVEDIIDSGLTIRYLLGLLEQREPKDVRVVSLLRKAQDDARRVPVDWLGFEIPDEFVVGYGLDFAGKYRNLPYVAVLASPSTADKPSMMG